MLIQLLVMAVMVSAASAACACDQLEVTASALNVRSGPSTGYGVIGQVYSGNCLSKLGSCGAGWDKVSVSGKVGCVSSAYVRYTGPCCNNVIVLANVLNYRSGPSPATILGQVYKDNCFQVVGTCGTGWYRIPKGCVSAGYVQCTSTCPASNSQSSSTCMAGMCAGRKNEERGCDGYGCGHYGASRKDGTSTHKGSDVICSGGEDVTAPFDGKVIRKAVPYESTSCENDGFLFESTDPNFPGISVMVFYVKDYKLDASLKRGDKIGTHIDLHCRYASSMTDHIHVAVYNGVHRVDPTKYLYCN